MRIARTVGIAVLVLAAIIGCGQQELEDTRAELEATQAELAEVRAELSDAKAQLAAAETELRITKDKLAEGETELGIAKKELEQAEEELAAMRTALQEANNAAMGAFMLLLAGDSDFGEAFGDLLEQGMTGGDFENLFGYSE